MIAGEGAVLAGLLILIAGLLLWALLLLAKVRRSLRAEPEPDTGLTLLQQQFLNLSTQFREGLSTLTTQMLEVTGQIGARLEATGETYGNLQESLGRLEEASRRILEVGRDISGLQEILKSPKLRGNLGEWILEDLLSQVLPQEQYSTQYGFPGGETVDAVIRLGEKLVPVDSKFPLENFRRSLEAAKPEEKRAFRKEFVSDVRRHVDAIAAKYIRPGEGTYDFALMYIPAENVYYEIILREEGTGRINDYALRKRVIPVSPNLFFAYLQVVALGLRGMQIEESAREIIESLGRLRRDFRRFHEEFDKLGSHLRHAEGTYGKASNRLERLTVQLEEVDRPVPAGASSGPGSPPPGEDPKDHSD